MSFYMEQIRLGFILQDKNLQQLKTKVAVTEQELLDKEQLVAQMASSLEATQGQKVIIS